MRLKPLNKEEETTMTDKFIKTALFFGVLMAFAPGAVLAVDAPPKSGATSYTTHFVFVPKSTVDIAGVGKAVALEATGPTENTKGDAFLDKMTAKCAAVNVDSGG